MLEQRFCTHDKIDHLRFGVTINTQGQQICLACSLPNRESVTRRPGQGQGLQAQRT